MKIPGNNQWESHTQWRKFRNQEYHEYMAKARHEEMLKKMIHLRDTQIIFPHLVKSQEEWDTLWPQLKEAGYIWAEGDELDKFFSDCYDFPEYINENEEGSNLLVIEDSQESPLDNLEEESFPVHLRSGKDKDYDDYLDEDVWEEHYDKNP